MIRKNKIKLYRIISYFKNDFSYDVESMLDYFNIIRKIKFLYRRYLNLKYYFPIIWNDYWFDSHFLYVILQAKLGQMEYYFRKEGITVSSEKYADEIKEILDDLIILTEGKIEDEEYAIFSEKYPITDARLKSMKLPFSLVTWNPEQTAYHSEMIDRIKKREDELRFKIFNNIAEKSPNWWD
jgi:hypothetical protein